MNKYEDLIAKINAVPTGGIFGTKEEMKSAFVEREKIAIDAGLSIELGRPVVNGGGLGPKNVQFLVGKNGHRLAQFGGSI